MAWFKDKNKLNGLAELKKNLLVNPNLVLPELTKELKQQDFATRWLVLKEILPLLEKNKSRDIVRLLLADNLAALIALVEERPERELAIECLGYLPSREVIELLAKLLNHKDDAVQLMASGALQNHTPRLVVPLLVGGLLREDVSAARAGQVLLTMGFFAQEVLLEAYREARPQVQARFLELMVLGDNPKCQSLVEMGLKSSEPFLKKKALEAVEFFSFGELWTEVVMCLAEEDWTIRAKTLEVLAKLKETEALEFVEPFVQDGDPWVSQCASRCVQSLMNKARIEENVNEAVR